MDCIFNGDPQGGTATKTGALAAQPQRDDMRSYRVEARVAEILALREARKDVSGKELRRALSRMASWFPFAVSTAPSPSCVRVWREKTLNVIEQDRPVILKQRSDCFECQIDLASERLVFIEET